MTASNRLPSFLATMVWEGGATVSKIRSDAGNWTGNRVGIGQLKGTKWGVAAGSHPTLDIAALTPEAASKIFELQYWRPVGGDGLPAGFDHCVSDDSFNAGPFAAARRLRLIQVRRLNDPASMIHEYSKARLAFLHALKTWKIFAPGWSRRVAGVEAESLRMAFKEQNAAPAPSLAQSAPEPRPRPLYPTPADLPRAGPPTPISAATVAREADLARGAATAASKGAGGAASATGAGSSLAATGHIPWALWAACGALTLVMLAVCLWRWRAHGARARSLSVLANEMKDPSHVKP